MAWSPSVTVAAVIENAGRFLLVEEDDGVGPVYNQPAGHWERGETLIEACAREVLEESAHRFQAENLVGIYRWSPPGGDKTYLRFAFAGKSLGEEAGRQLDQGIIRAVWLTQEEIRAASARHRSPLVWRCIEDFLSGRRYPLDLIDHLREE